MSTPSEFHSQIAVSFDDLYQKSPDFKQRYEVWTRLLPQYIPSGAKVLDMGCGSGIFSLFLAQSGHAVLGIDGAEQMIALCNARKTQLGVQAADFQRAELPLPAGFLPEQSFGAVISSSVLEYIDDLAGVLQNVDQALTTGGIFVVSFPNRDSLYRKLERLFFRLTGKPAYYQYVRHVLSATALDGLLEPMGYKRLYVEYYANNGKISRILSSFLPLKRAANLFVGVYRKTG
jgi:SAM-dependent methyltransferase